MASAGAADGAESSESPLFQIEPEACVFPRAVSLVAFGVEKSPWAIQKLTSGRFVPNRCWIMDVRDIMKDPLQGDRVKHGMNAHDESTQIACIGQDSILEACTDLLSNVWELMNESTAGADGPELWPLLVPVHCRTGDHRAHTCAEVVNSLLNSLEDRDGHKLFESQVFALSSCSNRVAAESMLDHAWEWAECRDKPYTQVPLTSFVFGKTACRKSRAAWANIERLIDLRARVQEWYDRDVEPKFRSPLPTDEENEGNEEEEAAEEAPEATVEVGAANEAADSWTPRRNRPQKGAYAKSPAGSPQQSPERGTKTPAIGVNPSDVQRLREKRVIKQAAWETEATNMSQCPPIKVR